MSPLFASSQRTTLIERVRTLLRARRPKRGNKARRHPNVFRDRPASRK